MRNFNRIYIKLDDLLKVSVSSISISRSSMPKEIEERQDKITKLHKLRYKLTMKFNNNELSNDDIKLIYKQTMELSRQTLSFSDRDYAYQLKNEIDLYLKPAAPKRNYRYSPRPKFY